MTTADQRRFVDEVAGQAHGGDAAALELLLLILDRHRIVVPAVRRVIADDGLAEEVVQDVLIVVAEQIATFRAEATFRSWLFGVARNQAKHHLRSYLRQPEATDVPATDRPTVRISSIVAQRHDVTQHLDKLPEHYRLPVTMRDMDGLTYEDIAGRLGVELGTVRSRISRGRALLAARIGSR